MTYPLVIQPLPYPTSINSLGLKVVKGSLAGEFGAVMEQLESPGVDSQRARERKRKYPDLVLEVSEDFTTAAAQLARENDYALIEGELADVTIQPGNGLVQFKSVTVAMIQVVARIGPSFGINAKVGSLTTLVSHWTLWRQKRAVGKL